MRLNPVFLLFPRIWRGLLCLCIFVCCVRFETAALVESYPESWGVAILIAGSLVLGWFWRKEAILAFTFAIPLLIGLSRSGLLLGPSPLGLVFSGIVISYSVRGLVRMTDPTVIKGHPGGMVIDIMITGILLSLGARLWHFRTNPELLSSLGRLSEYSKGNPFYFVTSAFIYLQGIFYFRLLSHDCPRLGEWCQPVLITFGLIQGCGFLLQAMSHVPELYNGYVAFMPYEDISSFGSIAVAIFSFFLTIHGWEGRKNAFRLRWILEIGGLFCLFLLVAASWSRAAWLAAMVVVVIIACWKWPYKWTLALAGLCAASIAVINLNAHNDSWDANPYLWRLIRLTQIEHWSNKDPTRVELWLKALRMIRARPVIGHGIGSFFLDSVRYARPGDPYGLVPDFAHDYWLQIAAELGLPFMALFTGLAVYALRCGFHKFSVSQTDGIRDPDRLILLGLTMALMAYLFTQLTGVSLNAYLTNQFFLWFLIAAIFSQSARFTHAKGEPPGRKQPPFA